MKTPDGSIKTILVVEDEPAISDICRRVLASEGFEVDVAVNGMVAQDMIEEKQYDLCLIDMRTPSMNGKELYQWLKEKHPRLARMQGQVKEVLGLTGIDNIFKIYASVEDATRSFSD